jgi:cobalamin biosynthesis Mg chelatase CobN
VLISRTGEVKLIDFGIARQGLSVLPESGARPGKVTYMSPEQVKGAPVDGRSDIFCLGTILYEITLGKRLWRGPREVASRRIVEDRPKPPTFVRRDYPTDLELIVLRALEKRPEDRYQSATELHTDLQNFLEQSNAHLRNNFQMADYVAKIFSEEADALISDAGRKRAQAFVEGGEAAEPEQEDLDFDRPAEGPGATLARALRASALGVWAEPDASEAVTETESALSDAAGKSSAEHESIFSESAEDLRRAAKGIDARANQQLEASKAASASELGGTAASPAAVRDEASETIAKSRDNGAGDNQEEHLPRRWSGALIVGIVLAAALGMGVVWWLRNSGG